MISALDQPIQVIRSSNFRMHSQPPKAPAFAYNQTMSANTNSIVLIEDTLFRISATIFFDVFSL